MRSMSLVFFMLLFIFISSASPYNLIQNPGAEEPLVSGEIPGWTEEAGTTWTSSSLHLAYEGNYYFWAAASNPAKLTQTVDVSAYSREIDLGIQQFRFSGWTKSYDQSPVDAGVVEIDYLNASFVSLSYFNSGEYSNTSEWEQISDTRTAPAGTKYIRIRLNSIRKSGTNNDAYFDDLSLTAEPIPHFTDSGISFTGVYKSSAAWGDYDSDGDLDVVITGATGSGVITKIYRNNGNKTFSDISAAVTGLFDSAAAWGDYDNDGDLDLLICGYNSSYYSTTKIYRNDSGAFFELGAGLTGVGAGSADWGDYDSDGDLDILITGNTDYPGDTNVSLIYRNDSGSFVNINAGLIGVKNSSAVWGDYNNDGDLDILLSGWQNSSAKVSEVYVNFSGIFYKTNTYLADVDFSSVAWGDYDMDGDPDILLTGTEVWETAKIYRNDSGQFTDIKAELTGAYRGAAAWGDYDNDGDLDVMISGYNALSSKTKIYRNVSGIFIDNEENLPFVDFSSAAWGDFDNDGDLDILLAGDSGSSKICKIFENDPFSPNQNPSAPLNLSSEDNMDGTFTFSWDKSTDNETLQDGLSYNFYLGTSSAHGQLMESMSNNLNGYRKIVKTGNAGHKNNITLGGIESGKYYWSVQAVDNSFSGSEFAAEQSFTILGEFQNIVTNINGANLELSWDPVIGATSYKVYSSDEPYSGFVLEATVLTGEMWSTSYTDSKKFYYVVAVAE